MATPVTGLDIEAIQKRPSLGIAFFDSWSMRPCSSKWAIRPLRATSVTAPVMSCPSM